jgi:hypothetical protein
MQIMAIKHTNTCEFELVAAQSNIFFACPHEQNGLALAETEGKSGPQAIGESCTVLLRTTSNRPINRTARLAGTSSKVSEKYLTV